MEYVLHRSRLKAVLATTTGPSNAFEPASAVSINSVYNSLILGAVPLPRINPNPATGGSDPAFVGEMLSTALGLPLTASRDWRLLPGSPLRDLGTSPIGGLLVAGNGTAYAVPDTIATWSHLFDGEGYGNLRWAGLEAAIGFDEESALVVAGGYGNDSRTWGTSPSPMTGAPVPGLNSRVLIFPQAGQYFRAESRVAMPYPGPFVTPGGFRWAYTTPFGTMVPPLIIDINFIIWLQIPPDAYTMFTLSPFQPVPLATGYTPPFDTGSYSFGLLPDASAITGAAAYVSEQAFYVPAGGMPVFSNLQSSYD